MQVNRGVTSARIYGTLADKISVPIMNQGVIRGASSTAVVEDGGTSANASSANFQYIKRTQQNETGIIILFLGPYDLTEYKKLRTQVTRAFTCFGAWFVVGITLDKSVVGMTTAQRFAQWKAGAVELGYWQTIQNYTVVNADISGYDGSYYIYFECCGNDNSSTSKTAELDIYFANLEA